MYVCKEKFMSLYVFMKCTIPKYRNYGNLELLVYGKPEVEELYLSVSLYVCEGM